MSRDQHTSSIHFTWKTVGMYAHASAGAMHKDSREGCEGLCVSALQSKQGGLWLSNAVICGITAPGQSDNTLN